MSSIPTSESVSDIPQDPSAEPAESIQPVAPEATAAMGVADTSAAPAVEPLEQEQAAAPAQAAARPVTEMSPAACAAELKQRFPALFAGAPKPLKLRIQVDIQQRAPGVFTKNALSTFFRRYTGSTSYLIAVSRAPQRIDLDGQPAGEISAEHRQIALDELARRRESQDSRRELEEQQRRNRAGLLRDFETTTLTRPNFCALKGVAVEELDGLLEIARVEAIERARMQPAFDPRQQRPPQRPQQRQPQRSGGPGTPGAGGERPPRGPGTGGDRPPRGPGAGGDRPPRPPRPR
jgi:ProP effector